GAVPPRTSGTDRVGMGRVRQSSQGEVLLADDQRAATAPRGSQLLGSALRCHQPGARRDPQRSMTTKLRSFLSALVRGRRLEREMEDEWRFHLDQQVDALIAAGASRREAEQTARVEFGDPLRWKEEGREALG